MPKQQFPRVGDLALVRGQRWRIVDVRPYPACKVVSLTGAGATNTGHTARVITPFDRVEVAASAPRMRLVGVRRWRHRCRALLASHGPADRLQSALHARIELLPHQLEPVLAIVRGLACRVLIADEVGLGKTIQAGLIVAEVKARQAADRVLILTPAGLREQWAHELRYRFELDPEIMDKWSVRKRSALLPVGVNPWATVALAIASYDYVKQPDVEPALAACRWDLVVVDEAHNITAGSDRRAAVDALCRRASYVVLLTATPHSGSAAAFKSLCAIGAPPDDRLYIFRRSRAQVALSADRRVHLSHVRPTDAERDMHATLMEVAAAAAGDDRRSRDVWLAIAVLQKRSLSSAHALALTVARRLESLNPHEAHLPCQLGLPLVDAGELDGSDESPAWIAAVLSNAAEERRLMTRLARRAAAASLAESKVRRLDRLLHRLGRLGESAIVFTEYRDTLEHLRRHIRCDCAILHGGLTRDERRVELERFVTARCRVLLATDAGGEGLNLHVGCRVVVNLELPWNPMRLEQRIGRVDRIGQTRRVHVFHLVASATAEMRILDRLKAKLARARADISASNPFDSAEAEHDEAEIAREIAGLDRSRERLPSAPSAPLARLVPEANRESARLQLARLMSERGQSTFDLPDADLYITRTRRRETRSRLGGHLLMVVQTLITDAQGRQIASLLHSLLIAPAVQLTASDFQLHLSRLMSAASAPIGAAGEERLVSLEIYRAFLAARRQRDLAILDGLDRDRPAAQPGLFDRRSLREAVERMTQTAELKEEISARMASAADTVSQEFTMGAALFLIPADRW